MAILNNDVKLRSDWLEHSVAWLADPSIAFVAGKTLSDADPTRIDGTYDAVCRGGCALRCGAGRPDGPYWSHARSIQFAPFTAVLIRRGVYKAVGGLDETFESYLEDVEFGLRCASRRYTGMYEPGAIATTGSGSATLGRWNPVTVKEYLPKSGAPHRAAFRPCNPLEVRLADCCITGAVGTGGASTRRWSRLVRRET